MASNEWLVRKLHEQDKKIEALSRGGTGVGHTSIAPGEALTVISEDGEVALGAGGVEYVDGPTPATPSAPSLKLGFGTIEVTWDGSFAAGEDENGIPITAPIDLALVEIHASTDPDEEEWGGDTLKAQVKTKDGFTVTIGGFDVDDEVHVCLIAVSEVPKRSAPSATASLVIEGLDFSQLFNELDAANATIKNAGEILVTEQGTLGEKLAESDAALDALEVSLGELDETTLPALRNDLDAAEGRLDSAEGQITDAFGELALVPGQITDATQDALIAAATDAQARADAAQAAADEAARAYAEAIATGIEPVDLDALRDHMNTKAAQAKQAAIDAAALDATAKANAAKADAIASAASDATSKANAARVAAEAKAATAQAKADLANDRAQAILQAGNSIVPNGDFENPSVNIWPNTSVQTGISVVTVPHARSGSNVMRIDSSTANRYPLTDWRDSAAGRIYYCEVWVYHNDTDMTKRGRVSFYAQPLLENGSTPGQYGRNFEDTAYVYVYQDQIPVRTWTKVTSYIKTPANTLKVRIAPHCQNNETPFDFDDLKVIDVTESLGALRAANAAQVEAEAAHAAAGSAQSSAVAAMDRANAVKGEAAADAQAKADAAAMAAEVAAKAYALAQANGASADALAAAKADATAKADAAQAAAELASRAHADGLPKVLHGTTAPAGTAPNGSIWWQHETNLAGAVIGQWNRVSGVWQSTPVGSEAIANLDAGKLTAGTAAIASAVVQKIAAQTASIQQADIKNLFVTGTASLSNVVAERIAAETAEFIELEVGNLVAGTGTMDEATINKLFADVVVAGMSIATEFIGENAILTGAVTAPKITASEELWAKIGEFVKIRAEQIEADAIDGMVITGPTIQSGRSGRRWIGDPNGIRIINEDNDVRTQLSPDGSTFKGEVEAETLVVNDGAELKGNNTLAQGAKLTLAAGVTDPTAPPVVQPYWDGIEFDYPVYGSQLSLRDVTGLAFDGTNYWTVKKSGNWGDWPDGVFGNAVRINATTGATTGFAVPFTDSNERFGVTCVGSELFWLYRSGFKAFVLVTDLNCVKLREWEYPELGYSKTNPLTYKPGIGNDGTNIVIAHCFDAGSLGIRTYSKTTGAQIGGVVRDTNDDTASNITGVYVGNADWGRKLATVAKSSTSELPSFSTTTGVYDGAATKFSAAAQGSVGVVFHDGKFHTLDPSGAIHTYADNNTGDNSGDWWVTYYWYTDVDDDNIIESSDYRSRMAPPERFTWPRRAGLKILGQPMPSGVEALGPALAKKTTTPVRTDFSGPGWQVDAGKSSARYVTLPTNWTMFASPPATNTFPEAESSVLESASGTFRLRGDGSGQWGPLKMGRNGVMSGLITRGQVAITPDSANTVKQVTVNLPAGRFSKPPVVWAQLNTGVPHWCSLGVYQPTDTNTFTMFLTRTNTTTTDVYWFAMDSE